MRRLLASILLASFGLFLAPSVALALCTTDADCSMGQVCQLQFGSGTCVFPPSTTCTTDADCSGGKTCQATAFNKFECLPAPAAGTQGQPAGSSSRTVTLVNPLGTASVPELVGNIIKAAVGVVGAFALLIFVYGGFLWLTSGGEAGKIQAGKDAMKWAAIGLIVVFSSYALVSFVLSALTQRVG